MRRGTKKVEKHCAKTIRLLHWQTIYTFSSSEGCSTRLTALFVAGFVPGSFLFGNVLIAWFNKNLQTIKLQTSVDGWNSYCYSVIDRNFFEMAEKISQLGLNVRKYRLVNTVTVRFNTIMGQLTEVSQWRNKQDGHV